MKALKGGLLRRLARILGQQGLLTNPADLACYGFDASGYSAMPALVALPTRQEQVCELLAIASEEGIPVYPRGAGSGTVGGAVPEEGGMVVSLARMNSVGPISTVDLSCLAGPGAVTGEIQRQVEAQGLFYPPDPASLAFCTIGGNVATCAGGARAVKYGVTRDYVRRLEIALPDGTLLRLGTGTAKGVAGLDLVRLMVGSEGLLGIITAVELRLLPLPEGVETLVALFPDAASAVGAVTLLFENGLLPRCAEFLDHMSLKAIGSQLPLEIPPGARAMLLLEFDGSLRAARHERDSALSVVEGAGALTVVAMENEGQRAAVWKARRGLSPALKRLGFARKVSEDVCVPRSRMAEMVDWTTRTEREDARFVVFGHAGDGNLHVNLLLGAKAAEDDALAGEMIESLMKRCLELGGTITGEHGIGIAKRPYLPLEHERRHLELEMAIKGLFDPKGVMNPHKVFYQ